MLGEMQPRDVTAVSVLSVEDLHTKARRRKVFHFPLGSGAASLSLFQLLPVAIPCLFVFLLILPPLTLQMQTLPVCVCLLADCLESCS